ncbi:CCHC-type domain-containing protein, partial [Durusdinium trenchii]
EAVKHWPFFLELMKSTDVGEDLIEICALFILDVLLLRGPELPEGAAAQGFAALRGVLGPPRPPAPPLQRRLSERLITLLLYGHWEEEVELDASWLLAWLMIEAFHHPSPESSTKVDMEAARQAALRGRLLCFLGCLGRASVVHAKRLTSALRLLLSTDLWQLGKQIPLSSGPRQGAQVWRALHLPRLVRLVCQQLAASCAASSGGKAQDYAELWLQVWRSLVVLGLEFPEDAQLPELFSATAFALQPLGALPAPLQKAPGWRPLASEVLASCREIAKAAGSEEASWPVIRSLMARLSEEVQDAPERWQAADTLRERKHLRQQLAARQIGVEVPDTASRGGGQRRSLSDDDSSTGPRKKKKRIARKLFVGPPC